MSGTVLVLGNGFDLDLGWSTRFSDYANSDYWPKSQSLQVSPLQDYLAKKKTISDWFDLEQILLDYCKWPNGYVASYGVTSKDCNIINDQYFFENLQSSLGGYLENEQQKHVNPYSCAAMLLKELMTDGEELDYIYSFNYTSFEKICRQLTIENSDQIRCIHVHGALEDYNIILGVDDSLVSRGYEFLQKTVNVHYRSTSKLPF